MTTGNGKGHTPRRAARTAWCPVASENRDHKCAGAATVSSGSEVRLQETQSWEAAGSDLA